MAQAPPPTDTTTEIPDYYEAEIAAREHIADECPVDVYTASVSDRWGWRWKLASYYEARPATARSCEMMMVDSGYARKGSIRGVLEAAERYGADTITTTDITPACDGYGAISPREEAYERHADLAYTISQDWDGDVLLPLHPPFDEAIEELQSFDPERILGYEDNPHFDMPRTEEEREMYRAGRAHFSYTLDLVSMAGGVAIGGLKDLPVKQRIEALRTVNRKTPTGIHVHALAPGTEPPMIRALRSNPGIVDSIDVSTPERAVANNKLPDKTWVQRHHPVPTGEDSSTVRGQYASAIAVQLAFMLTPHLCDDESLAEGASYQTALGDVA